MPWRSFILKVHLYSGLVCFWYLIVLATSSLNFNHHFSFMQGGDEKKKWATSINIQNNFSDDLQLSEAIRDSLSLIGWPLPWETWHDSTGFFHFVLEHPGKSYVIDYVFVNKVATVTETTKGFWSVFNSLHSGGSVPNSAYMTSWKWYSRLSAILVVFSVFTGIYVWYRSTRDKKAGWIILVISIMISVTWMLQLYFIG